MKHLFIPLALLVMTSCTPEDKSTEEVSSEKETTTEETTTKDTIVKKESNISSLGVFSMSMSVADLQVSKEFYEKLGFSEMGGGAEMNYLIMNNGNTIIGLFQGMFEGNILTFNPGWDENAENLEEFDDIRVVQQKLQDQGITIDAPIEAGTEGPASIMITDPDGNVILLDQHR